MTDLFLVASLAGLIVLIFLQVLALKRNADPAQHVRGVLREELSMLRQESANSGGQLRTEIQQQLSAISGVVMSGMTETRQATSVATENTVAQLERMRESVAQHVKELQEGNEKKLEQMRLTVDEQLHATLERRLGESFQKVQQQLESVQRGLGEMQQLAVRVGDLSKVLANVKTAGIFGEVQLQAILEEILTPDQYVRNYAPSDDSKDNVEFAVSLPGTIERGEPVYVPIDSKFPQEAYRSLVDAMDLADTTGIAAARLALYQQVRGFAKYVEEKYVAPPKTTPFGIVFLPTESLYAEVLRQPGLVQELQRDYHIVLAGPTTMAAFLNSLRMGFSTVALQKHAGEIKKVLEAVKAEFSKFGSVLDKLGKQLGTAQTTIASARQRTRAMERKLKAVDSLGAPGDSARLLAAAEVEEVGESPLEEEAPVAE